MFFGIKLPKVIIFYFSTYLSDGIFALDKGQDTFALDGGGVLKTITVDSSKDTLLQAHVVKLINFQVPVRFENLFNYLICSQQFIRLTSRNLL